MYHNSTQNNLDLVNVWRGGWWRMKVGEKENEKREF